MKTNISVMGLSVQLQPYLDALEDEPFDEEHFQQIISQIKSNLQNALPEARHFYSTF
jgi:hypothetical protein